jgi:hypothetical protein
MDFLDYHKFLPQDFNLNSRVWIYQSSRMFFMGEALQIEELLETFVQNWQSHGTPVKGYANLLFGQFVIFIADETAAGVSGCSTDSSVRLVKELEQLYKVNLFDRNNLAFIVKDKIQTFPLAQFSYAINNGFITPQTPYFNNTVLNLEQLQTNWIVPAADSWLKTKVTTTA